MVVILINLFNIFGNLDISKQRRCFKSLSLLDKLCHVNPSLSALKGELYVLVLAYNIGQEHSISKLKFPALDGAIYVDSLFSDCHDIACAIAHQGNAQKLSQNRFNDIYDKYKIDNPIRELFLEIIDLIDSHVSYAGEITSFEGRFMDIFDFYGRQSLEARLFKASIARLGDLEDKFNWDNKWIECW